MVGVLFVFAAHVRDMISDCRVLLHVACWRLLRMCGIQEYYVRICVATCTIRAVRSDAPINGSPDLSRKICKAVGHKQDVVEILGGQWSIGAEEQEGGAEEADSRDDNTTRHNLPIVSRQAHAYLSRQAKNTRNGCGNGHTKRTRDKRNGAEKKEIEAR